MALSELDQASQDVRLSPSQRRSIADLAAVLKNTTAPGLNQEQVKATIAGKPVPTVQISLPHRENVKQMVDVFVEPDAVVFSYDGDHMHFGYGEPDPPIEAAMAFLHDLLRGRIEVDVRGWLLATGVTTYRLADDGTRVKLQQGGYLGWIKMPFRRKTRRISFQ